MEKNLFEIADLIAMFHEWLYILDVKPFFLLYQTVAQ
jgi:hypothetical protein